VIELDVSFVCQNGELEAMACLLAASLRRHHGGSLHLHVIEPVPAEEYGEITPRTRAYLDGLDVRWYRRENPVSHQYKIFNKLNAFRIEPQTEKTLFLDSDILVRRPLDGLRHYFGSQLAARMENQQRYSGREDAWRAAYGLFGLDVPAARWTTIDTSEWGPPYFNAGVVLVDSNLDFSEVWSDTCRRIHEAGEVWEIARDQHRGTVQIGMPIAMARLGLEYELLSGQYHIFLNRMMRRRRLNWPEDQVRLVHYNEWTHVLSDERIGREVDALIREEGLEPIFESAPETHRFLEDLRSSGYRPRRSMFLPTSLLVNTAAEAQPPASHQPLRVLVMPGAGIEVEIPGDGGIELASGADAVPRIASLARDLKDNPETRVLLLIDEPLAAIARWQADPQLWQVAPELLAIDPESISEHIAERCASVAGVSDPVLRRAGFWELLATAANQPHPALRILRRRDLIDDLPAAHAALQAFTGRPLSLTVEQSDAANPLPMPDAKTVRDVCAFIAGSFGYTL